MKSLKKDKSFEILLVVFIVLVLAANDFKTAFRVLGAPWLLFCFISFYSFKYRVVIAGVNSLLVLGFYQYGALWFGNPLEELGRLLVYASLIFMVGTLIILLNWVAMKILK